MQNVDGVVQNVWAFEDRQISLLPTSAILVRIIIGKVADEARLRKAFDKTPIRAGSQGYEDWNCVSWLKRGSPGLLMTAKGWGTVIPIGHM